MFGFITVLGESFLVALRSGYSPVEEVDLYKSVMCDLDFQQFTS